MTHARSPERPVILLSCPPGETRLCQAMEQALARAASGRAIVRIVARGDEAPARPGDLGVALHLDNRQTHSLEGHLEWQTAGDSARRTGPRVRFDVMDAILSPHMYAQFAQGLIQADTAMQGTLAP